MKFRHRYRLARKGYLKFIVAWLEENDPRTEDQINLAFNEFTTRKKLRRAKTSSIARIGDEYERYVAEQYFNAGDDWTVEHSGENLRLNDLGRDLIATRNDETVIVQCKYWAAPKVIHERHVFQLFGTTYLYRLEHPNEQVLCLLITSTVLSDTAKNIAKKLGVEYKEKVNLERFVA